MRITWIFIVLPACLAGELPDEGAARQDRDAADARAETGVPDGSLDAVAEVAPGTDTGLPDDVAVSSPSCRAGNGVASQGLVRFDDHVINVMPVALSGATLIGRRSVLYEDGTLTSLMVTRTLPGDAEQVIASADLTMPIAADGGALLYSTMPTGVPGWVELYYRDLGSAAAPTLLFRSPVATDEAGSRFLTPRPFGWDEARRVVEPGAAVWAEVDEDLFGSDRVRLYHDGVIDTVWESDDTYFRYPSDLYLRNRNVLWLTNSSPNLWLGGAGREAISIAGYNLSHALTNDAAWWVTDGGAVMRMDLASGVMRQVYDGPCGGLHADARRVFAVCGAGVFAYDDGPTRGHPVVLDGDGATVFEARGSQVGGLRIEGEHVAWIAYGDDVGGCQQFAHGTLMLARLDAPGASVALAEVGSGAWQCDNSGAWPRIDVALTSRGIAWNYPLSDATGVGASDQDFIAPVGWALFDEPCP